MTIRIATVTITLAVTSAARAQHAGHGPEPLPALLLDEAREGSGTSWQPEAAGHAGLTYALGAGELFLHGSAAVAHDHQRGPRGDDQFVGLSWVMAMLRAPVGPTRITVRAMASLDPFTLGPSGYPLLLQSGEARGGVPLRDRQHPHDLFMDLSASWRVPLSRAASLVVYAAAVGEPALGPTAAPHRISARYDPAAPISHHWMDSTHISFGVVTAGLATRFAKLEASAFNGREPNDRRTDLEKPHLDSWSARLCLALHPTLSAQLSHGRLKSPELLAPEENLRRTTASVTWAAGGGATSATLAWGRNAEPGGHDDDAWLLEGTWDVTGRDAVFGRVEWVEKSNAELVVPGGDPDVRHGVTSLAAGYLRSLPPYGPVVPGVGVRAGIGFVPGALRQVYGGDPQLGLFVYLLLRPASHSGGGHAH